MAERRQVARLGTLSFTHVGEVSSRCVTLASILVRRLLTCWIGISHLAYDILKEVAEFLGGLSLGRSTFGSHIIRCSSLVDAIIDEDYRFRDGLLTGKDITVLRLWSAIHTHGAKVAFH